MAFGIPTASYGNVLDLSNPDFSNFRGIRELVTNAVREKIVTGELPPGTVLLQRDLAATFGVSREPVRHALAVLEAEGLILSRPRRPVVVAPITVRNIDDVYEVRAELDALTARRSARSAVAREGLAAALPSLFPRSPGASLTADQLTHRDRDFHRAIYAAADNRVALEFFDSRWVVVGRVMALIASSDYLETAWNEHRLIMDAICAGDEDRAAELSKSHAIGACEWLIRNAHLLGNWIGDGSANEVLLGQ
jgi:DNA-binding GntR family transcriptional regulator